MKTKNDKIKITENYDRFARNVTLGDLTERQYCELSKVLELSPGYSFTVIKYQEADGKKGSSATHVQIEKDGVSDYVGLVGRDCAQYYDNSKTTEQVVMRVAHRIYRQSGLVFR
jgi:hypothetical protein